MDRLRLWRTSIPKYTGSLDFIYHGGRTMPRHTVTRTPVVEAKASIVAAAVSAFVLSLLARYVFGSETPEFVIAFVDFAVTSVATGVLTFVGGWIAGHTPCEITDTEVTHNES